MRYIDYVNVRMGTRTTVHRSCGNVNPFTAMPYGMNHYFLQTQNEDRWAFHADDVNTGGLRLSHIPSPWVGEYSKLIFCPTSGNGKNATRTDGGQESSFNIKEAIMTPAYISARLLRFGTSIEFSPTTRGGIIRMGWDKNISRFIPDGDTHRMIVFLDGHNNPYEIDYENGIITGSTDNFRSWRADHLPDNFKMFFALKLDHKLSKENTVKEDRGMSLAFEGSPETVVCRFATSFISVDQAKFNLENEVGCKSLENVRVECEMAWEELLSKIEIEAPKTVMDTFYSTLYRSLLFPRIFHEPCPDGFIRHYSPANGEICEGVMYTDNGFWDTYKTVYPLLSVITPDRYRDICQGFVNYYNEGGWLPRWMSPSALDCMPGTAIDAVFGDAAEKKVVTDEKLLKNMLEGLLKHIDNPPESPALGRDGWQSFNDLGYVTNKHRESVNKTQDYAYGNFCASQVAKALGDKETQAHLLSSAQNYKNLFDPETGFLRAKDENGNMRSDFTEFDWGGDYTEGGPWQNSFAVYHDYKGYSKLLGGRDIFLKKIEQLFATPPYFREFGYGGEIHEMTEMAIRTEFGQCALSNQPSFHLPYMFSCLGDRDRSAYWVKKCVRELFNAGPEGFPGDEDNGSMAAWYVFSALGFYPVCPGVAEYVIAAPSVDKAVVHLENGKTFKITAKDNCDANSYAKSITLNGKELDTTYITHGSIVEGGELEFFMSNTPSGECYNDDKLPYSLSDYQ